LGVNCGKSGIGQAEGRGYLRPEGVRHVVWRVRQNRREGSEEIDGVNAAKVSQPKGEAEITYDPAKTFPEAIAKRISDKTRFKAEAPKKAQ
jgi:hypothetical protein